MSSNYLPLAIILAFGVVAYALTNDSSEISSSKSSSATAQAAPSTSEGQQAREPFSLTKSLRFDRVWDKTKNTLQEGREDLVNAFTDSDRTGKGETSDQAAFEKSDRSSMEKASGY